MSAPPRLEAQLRELREEQDRIHERVRELLTSAERQPVNHDEVVGDWQFHEGYDRYAIVFPDGRLYDTLALPGMGARTTCFAQRPAAVRTAHRLPGARVYDARTRTIVYDAQTRTI